MERRNRSNLPLRHPGRIQARDAKLLKREVAIARAAGFNKIFCPCRVCNRGLRTDYSFRAVMKHIKEYGYHDWQRGRTENVEPDNSDEEWDSYIREQYGEISLTRHRPERDPDAARVEVEDIFRQALGVWDEIAEDINATEDIREQGRAPGNANNPEIQESDDEYVSDDEDRIPWGNPEETDAATAVELERLSETAKVPLHGSTALTSFEASTMLLNILRGGGVSNITTTQVFAVLHRVILPQPNTLPDSEHEASNQLRRLGLSFHSIAVCPNNCVLFRGRLEHAMLCPKCGSMKMVRRGNTWVPKKVLRHFPLVPRLKRLFSSPLQAALMTWHSKIEKTDNMIRHASQARAWKHIDNSPGIFDHFGDDPRNLRFGLATDGLNPFSEKRSVHSTWPVLLMNYNVPPWMTTKKYFIILSLIIPGPQSVVGDNFDVFLQPLLEELIGIWTEGVMMRDAASWNGQAHFILRAMVLWTIHDFPGYGMVAGCTTSGYRGCPVCGPNCCSRRSTFLGKNVWDTENRRHLPPDHSVRADSINFQGGVDFRPPPTRVTGTDVMQFGVARERWLAEPGNRPKAPDDPVHLNGIKRVSSLYQLPYWKDLLIRNTIDVMHVERNVCASVLEYNFGERDKIEVRRDMEKLGFRPELHLRRQGTTQAFLKPHAPYVLRSHETKAFLNMVGSIRTPTGYSAGMPQRVGKKKLQGLKSHDHHVIMQQILPAAIRGFLQPGPRDAIIRLGHVFQRICAKAIDPQELSALQLYVTETTCLLERWFPPGFFDVMPHLINHLVEELDLCGPVHSRWCYSVERYMYVLKQYVRNRARPEACMATGYIYSEALGYVAEHLVLYPGHRKQWTWEADDRDEGEVLEGGPKQRQLSDTERLAIHEFVINNSSATSDLYSLYKTMRTAHLANNVGQGRVFQSFSDWLENKVDAMLTAGEEVTHDVHILSRPPAFEVTEYPSMHAYGNHYRCEDPLLGSTHVSYDSGVASIINQRCRASVKDRNEIEADLKYVGVLRRIMLISYASLKYTVMKCSWVKPNLIGSATMRVDEYGFWLAKIGVFQPEDMEPYIFPEQASQVFFCPDVKDNGWKVVLQKDARSKRIEEELYDGVLGAAGCRIAEEEIFTQENLVGQTADGEQVLEAYVATINAEEEAPNDPRQYEDIDFFDDDDDDDVPNQDENEQEEVNSEEEVDV